MSLRAKRSNLPLKVRQIASSLPAVVSPGHYGGQALLPMTVNFTVQTTWCAESYFASEERVALLWAG